MALKPICIIPARGGSKRIARKNIAEISDRPMISWPIEIACECGLFSRVIVTTDDREIASIAKEWGAEVPFLREEELADDFATTAQVLTDALSRCPGHELACCLYPTAVMTIVDDIHHAATQLEAAGADCALAVTDYDFPPLRALSQNADGSLKFNWPEHELTRSQDLPDLVHDAGMFYFFRAEQLQKTGSLLGGKVVGVPIPRVRAIDIDTPEDLELARVLHRMMLDGRPVENG